MDIYFNKKEIYTTWNLSLLYGAIDALLAPAPLKDLKTQSSNGRDGVEAYNASLRVFDKRDFTLSFSQPGESLKDLYEKQQSLYETLRAGIITITVPDLQISFRCALKSFDNYAVNCSKMKATFKISFTETDPTNRSYESIE